MSALHFVLLTQRMFFDFESGFLFQSRCVLYYALNKTQMSPRHKAEYHNIPRLDTLANPQLSHFDLEDTEELTWVNSDPESQLYQA